MQRNSFTDKIRRAITRPQRIFPYLKRAWRNFIINRTSANQFEAHRRYIEDYGRENPNIAMGCETEEQWLQSGQQQMELLIQHGLQSSHRVLDLGCGNLRLGWRLIEFLDAGGYVGLELSQKMLEHARNKITHYRLQPKRPYLYLVEGDDYAFLPAADFDCIHAYGVFPSCTLDSFQRLVLALRPLLKPGGAFDFTYYETTAAPYCAKGMYYYHRREDIVGALEKSGLIIEWSTPLDAQHIRARARPKVT
jgi:SAM-dependent methyltransferase